MAKSSEGKKTGKKKGRQKGKEEGKRRRVKNPASINCMQLAVFFIAQKHAHLTHTHIRRAVNPSLDFSVAKSDFKRSN